MFAMEGARPPSEIALSLGIFGSSKQLPGRSAAVFRPCRAGPMAVPGQQPPRAQGTPISQDGHVESEGSFYFLAAVEQHGTS